MCACALLDKGSNTLSEHRNCKYLCKSQFLDSNPDLDCSWAEKSNSQVLLQESMEASRYTALHLALFTCLFLLIFKFYQFMLVRNMST